MDKASHLVFSPAYNTDLPAFGLNKPFALDRGELVLKALEEEFGQAPNVISPQPLDIEDVLLVHSLAYLESCLLYTSPLGLCISYLRTIRAYSLMPTYCLKANTLLRWKIVYLRFSY